MAPNTRGRRALEADKKDPPANKRSVVKKCYLQLPKEAYPNQSGEAESPEPVTPVRGEDDEVDVVLVGSSPENADNGDDDVDGDYLPGGEDVKKLGPKKNNRKKRDSNGTDGGSKKKQDVKRHTATKKHKRAEDDSDNADCITKEGKDLARRVPKKKQKREDEGSSEAKEAKCRTLASLDGLSGPVAQQLDSLIAALAKERKELNDATQLADFHQDEVRTVQNLLDNEQDKNSDLAGQLRVVVTRNKSLQTRVNNLVLDKKHLEEVTEHWRKELSEALAQQKPDYGDPGKVTDDMILEKWQSMQYLVHCAVDLRMRLGVQGATEPSIKSDRDVSSRPPAIVALCEECKQDPVGAPFRIQRYIWRRLCEEVFQARSGIWGGHIGEFLVRAVSKMRDFYKDDSLNLSLVSRMKYKTGKDIDQDIGRNQEAITKVVDKLCADLDVFCKPGEGQRLRETISDVCDKAVYLMIIMTRSRAIFKVCVGALDRRNGPWPFDPALMELKYSRGFGPAENSTVDFFVTPPVAKIGTADGGKFDQRIFVCKGAAVVCHRGDVEMVNGGSQTAPDDCCAVV